MQSRKEKEVKEYLTEEDYKTAEENGISREHVDIRFHQLKWSKKKTITHNRVSLKDENGELPVKKVKPPKVPKPPKAPLLNEEQAKIARDNWISTSTLKARLKKMPLEEAITLPLNASRNRPKREKKIVIKKKSENRQLQDRLDAFLSGKIKDYNDPL